MSVESLVSQANSWVDGKKSIVSPGQVNESQELTQVDIYTFLGNF
jgi:hypothetical protein